MGVRWDAVVRQSDFWADAERPLQAMRPPPAADSPVSVEVWLFGSLADAFAERPLTLQFRGSFSVADIVAELGRLGGRDFLERVSAPGGGVLSYCRVFVNGESVDDAAMPIDTGASPIRIEVIFLTAAEGG